MIELCFNVMLFILSFQINAFRVVKMCFVIIIIIIIIIIIDFDDSGGV
jgi:hypothetical protein